MLSPEQQASAAASPPSRGGMRDRLPPFFEELPGSVQSLVYETQRARAASELMESASAAKPAWRGVF